MSIFVYLSCLMAIANCAGMLYQDFGFLHWVFLGIVVLMSIFGWIFPGPDKNDGRVLSILGIVLGLLPLLREPIHDLRYTLKERGYAKEMRPRFEEWGRTQIEFSDSMGKWRAVFDVPPTFDGWTAMIPETEANASPTAVTPSSPVTLSLPKDPFNTDGEPLRYWTNSRDFWMVVSKGPDRKNDLTVPPSLRPTDQVDPRVRWIAINESFFPSLLYDPTNGSLGTGDVFWVGGSKEKTDAFREGIFTAWQDAGKAIAQTRSGTNDAQRAAEAGKRLLEEGNPMAALAAATYSMTQIPPEVLDQKRQDFEGRFVQGRALYALGDVRMAAAALAAYIQLDPNSTEGHFYLATALYHTGDKAGARRMFAAASQIDENHPLAAPAYEAMIAIGKNRPIALELPGGEGEDPPTPSPGIPALPQTGR